jgi:hypothetical protein
MRSSAVELKTVVKEMSEEFHATGNDLITVLLELEKYQKDVEKTKRVSESLRVCKEVSMFMCLAVKQIEDDQHYAALHTIQILQNEVADSIAIKPLVSKLEAWLPAVIDRLLVGAKREAETFLAFSLNRYRISYVFFHIFFFFFLVYFSYFFYLFLSKSLLCVESVLNVLCS